MAAPWRRAEREGATEQLAAAREEAAAARTAAASASVAVAEAKAKVRQPVDRSAAQRERRPNLYTSTSQP